MKTNTNKFLKIKLKKFENFSNPTSLRRSNNSIPTCVWFKGAGDLLILSSINRWATRMPSKNFAVPSSVIWLAS
ncbi:hypothetical protein AYI68_g4992, partial [Smittium mucronatum]